MKRLTENAKKMGANVIICKDFETSDILNGTATVFSAFGTAATVKPAKK